MANLATTMGIGVVLSFMAQGLSSIRSAERGLTSLFNTSTGGLTQMGTFAALALGSIVALTAGIQSLHAVMGNVQVYADYQEELARLAGVMDQPIEAMGMYEEAAMSLASRSRSTAQEVAAGMYEIASAGYEGDDVLSMMNASILLADTRELSMSEASETLTKVMHGFAIPAEQATDTLDMLGKAVAITQLHFDDLEQGFGTFGMTAHAAGQSLEDMLALYGSFVTSGLSASRAAMMVKMMTTTLMGMTPTARAFMDSLGVDYIDAATGQMRPLVDVIDDISESLEEGTLSGTEFEQVFGEIPDDIAEVEAMYKGLVAVFGRRAIAGYFAAEGYMYETADEIYMGTDALREMSSEITNADGFMQRYHETVMETWNAQRDMINTNIELIKLQLGKGLAEAFQPVLTMVVTALQNITAFLTAHPEVARAIGATGAILAAALTAGGVILTIASVMAGLALPLGAGGAGIAIGGATVGTIGQLLGVMLTKLLPVLGAIGIVLGAIVLAVLAVIRYWDAFKAAFTPMLDTLETAMLPVITVTKSVLDAISPVLKGILDVVLAFVAINIISILLGVVTILGIIIMTIRLAYNIVATVIAAVIALFTGDWTAFGEYMTSLWGSWWNDLVSMLGTTWEAVEQFFSKLWEKLRWLMDPLGMLSWGGGPSAGVTSAEWAATQPGGSMQDLPPALRVGSYSIPRDQWAFLHEDEVVTQPNQTPYTGASGNAISIGTVQLQVVGTNPSYDADALFDKFMYRLRRESERTM